MGQTLIEKIVTRYATGLAEGEKVYAGDIVSVRPKHVMTHDNTGAVMPKFASIGANQVYDPGQLVFYPILHLQQLGLGVSEYVRTLETIGIELLEPLGLTGQRRKGYPGLWVDERKIASIGVRVSRSVTRHGMAINITNDLSLFDLMVPCGLDNVQMTSVRKETGRSPRMEEVKTQLTALLRRYFGGGPS